MIISFAKPSGSVDLIGDVVKTAHIKSRYYTWVLQKYHTIDAV